MNASSVGVDSGEGCFFVFRLSRWRRKCGQGRASGERRNCRSAFLHRYRDYPHCTHAPARCGRGITSTVMRGRSNEPENLTNEGFELVFPHLGRYAYRAPLGVLMAIGPFVTAKTTGELVIQAPGRCSRGISPACTCRHRSVRSVSGVRTATRQTVAVPDIPGSLAQRSCRWHDPKC